ncbi:hypothetical protein ABPG73_003066 [Tetrahymena malaccensis]
MISILLWLLFELDSYLENNIPDSNSQANKFQNEIIVKGLSFNADENSIRNFLEENCGPVSSVKLLKNSQGRSKGVAFVSFEAEDSCSKALELSNSEFMGRYLIIEKTKPKTERITHLINDDTFKTSFSDTTSFNNDKLSNEVIVKNLSFETDEKSIGNYLEENCGAVSRVNLLKNDQRISKGIAFVSFQTEEGCKRALELNNSEFMGRNLIIEKAKPKTEKPIHQPTNEESKIIFVGNLSYETDEEKLQNFFMSSGNIINVRIAKCEGKSRGFGHVEFEDRSGVDNALKKSGEYIDGRAIRVDVAIAKNKRDFNN